jgi:hypothetical protein
MGNRKRDVYPTKYFTAADFPQTPMVLEIETARREEFENDGKSTEKLVVYFVGQKSGLIVGPTVWDQIADVMAADGVSKFDSDDYTKWKGHWLELYRDKTQFGGKMVDCIRVRKPGAIPLKKKKKTTKSDPEFPDIDDLAQIS